MASACCCAMADEAARSRLLVCLRLSLRWRVRLRVTASLISSMASTVAPVPVRLSSDTDAFERSAARSASPPPLVSGLLESASERSVPAGRATRWAASAMAPCSPTALAESRRVASVPPCAAIPSSAPSAASDALLPSRSISTSGTPPRRPARPMTPVSVRPTDASERTCRLRTSARASHTGAQPSAPRALYDRSSDVSCGSSRTVSAIRIAQPPVRLLEASASSLSLEDAVASGW